MFSSLIRFSGPTIHFVDEHYDTGRILAQRVVPVLPEDTAEELAARVLREVRNIHISFSLYLRFFYFVLFVMFSPMNEANSKRF